MAVFDYVKGELVTPEGKKVKKVTEGATPTDQATLSAPVGTGGGNFYAPGFSSNQTLDYEYYADDPVAQPDQAPGPTIGDPQGASQGNSEDASQDDKSGAGAIPDFESWAGAVLDGSSMVGAGGPILAAGQIATGMVDPLDPHNNYAVTDPTGWDAAVKEAQALYPGNPSMINTAAANIMAAKQTGNPSLSGNDRSNDPGLAGSLTEGKQFGPEDQGGVTIDKVSSTPGTVTTASGTKPKAAPAAPAERRGGFGGGGGQQGAAGNSSGGSGQRGGEGGDRTHGGGGVRGMAEGGYVSDADYGVPTSMRQTFKRPAAAPPPAQQQQPNGDGGYNQGGHVTGGQHNNPTNKMNMKMERLVKPLHGHGARGESAAMSKQANTPSRTQRYQRSRGPSMPYAEGGFVANAGFADGGVVPNQGYQDGGEVDRFNPPAAAVANDGVVDNQPINADEGEYVIQRESADILGPEILNALNDPQMAAVFSQLFDAALGMDAGSSTEGVSAAPTLPPKMPPKMPAAPAMGASLANDNGVEPPMPAFNKGGYVGKRY